MEQSNQSKRVLLSVIGVAILVVAVVGVSFAFFNYTRTGGANTVGTGRIKFTSTQTDDGVTVSNLFPLHVAPTVGGAATVTGDNPTYDASTANFARVVVHVAGETTYEDGLDYQVSAVRTNLTVGSQTLRLRVRVNIDSTTAQGNETDDSCTITTGYDAGKLLPTSKETLVSGHIAGTTTYGTGARYQRDIVIDAYLLDTDIAITDTATRDGSTVTGESAAWVGDRQIITTDEWNTLAGSNASFKILVESKESTTGSYVNSGNYTGTN